MTQCKVIEILFIRRVSRNQVIVERQVFAIHEAAVRQTDADARVACFTRRHPERWVVVRIFGEKWARQKRSARNRQRFATSCDANWRISLEPGQARKNAIGGQWIVIAWNDMYRDLDGFKHFISATACRRVYVMVVEQVAGDQNEIHCSGLARRASFKRRAGLLNLPFVSAPKQVTFRPR